MLPALTACNDDNEPEKDPTTGHTLTLTLKTGVEAIPETRALIREAAPESEAAQAGFYYELVSSDADSVAVSDPMTKAPTTLKNVYALLFKSDGTFNGRTNIGTMTANTDKVVTFTNVADPAATSCRLVIVANDNAATNNYASTGGTGNFANFTGNYAAFQALVMTNTISSDADVPYAGTATVNLFAGGVNATTSVQLYRTLAKVTLSNTFSITGGPARSSITLYNAGSRRFATQGSDNYDGTGTTQTSSFVATTAGSNANSNVWYVGENIRPAGSSISSAADRNSSKAPANASYIRITSAAKSIVNTVPAIGEEYIKNGTETFSYDIYLGKSNNLTDFSLRRHTNYTITSTVSGTLAAQEYLAANDGRVTMDVSKQAVGLCIGLLGGASGYKTGTSVAYTITGSYTKMLLLAPTSTNKSGMNWSDDETTQYQTESRKYWDHTYTSANIEKGSGYAYDYCNSLNVNGETGWYLPTQAQLMAIWAMLQGIDNGKFKEEYTTAIGYHWSSTEGNSKSSYLTNLYTGETNTFTDGKAGRFSVRCVKDAGQPLTETPMATTINGYPVIDLSALNPLGCLLSLSEANSRREAMHACTPGNTEYLSVGQAVSNHAGTWNAKMSTRYQLMRDKLTNSSGGTSMTWADAWNACKAYSGEGGTAGQWRLPTQRELQMIWVLHPQLVGKGGFIATNNSFWTATEGSDGKAGNAWAVNLYYGTTNRSIPKTSNYSVRCVRDI
ncbi:Lcl domain-containing protein [Parabacteroides chinchillae]|uniref:Uncharacterized protein n=1 Tax=Parabacteroides chinchillae TaxID=871327 RepID=A0A8G2FBZ8_9BACT|nr:DUF1566 domain-containing protein [Parabacteroides chinchillae]SEG19792.1 Protein of unknown function [Parabacteroides chinchillae]